MTTATASVGSASLNSANRLEALDRMSINDKLAYFARKDAFRLPKKDGQTWAAAIRLPRSHLPKKLSPGGLDLMDGCVTRQAYSVIGRPCYGIPLAQLLHGREHRVRPDGSLVFARCGECPIKAACQFICNERLIVNEGIREAFREFQRRGGAEAFWSREPSRSRSVAFAVRDLVRELQTAGFTSVNDKAVAEHYDLRRQQRRESDAERQRAHRKAVASEHSAASNIRDTASIVREAEALRSCIRAAQAETECRRWIAQIDATFAAQIWAVRASLTSRGEKHGATHIASALARSAPAVRQDALRKRVQTVLKRMPQIEALAENMSKVSHAP